MTLRTETNNKTRQMAISNMNGTKYGLWEQRPYFEGLYGQVPKLGPTLLL